MSDQKSNLEGETTKTRAAIVEKKGLPLQLEEVELADPGPGQVRIKMQACGICRSDLSAIDGKEAIMFPAVLGHEGAGVVDALGAGVSSLKEGDRVILSWTPACGTCPSCVRGEPQLCRKIIMSTAGKGPLRYQGRGLDRFMALGAFCEYIIVQESCAIRFNSEIPSTQACLIGCGVMTGFGAATKTASVRWSENVAVIGCGGVGLSAIQGARFAGAGRIFAVDPIKDRRRAALHVGATDALNVKGAVSKIASATGGGVDVAIECVGKPETMLDAFNLIRPGGRAIVVGLPALDEMLRIPVIMLLTEKSIKGSVYGSGNPAVDFPKLISLWEQGRLDLETLVGKTRPFSEINEGIAEMRSGKVTRVVLTF